MVVFENRLRKLSIVVLYNQFLLLQEHQYNRNQATGLESICIVIDKPNGIISPQLDSNK